MFDVEGAEDLILPKKRSGDHRPDPKVGIHRRTAFPCGVVIDKDSLSTRDRSPAGALSQGEDLVDEGFQHAMPAIIDANVTTVITAAFLFQFGTGPVKGFAVTLIISIVASLVTAVFVTRTLFLIWLQRRSAAEGLSI